MREKIQQIIDRLHADAEDELDGSGDVYGCIAGDLEKIMRECAEEEACYTSTEQSNL